jgi:type VI protein secretion system component VasK
VSSVPRQAYLKIRSWVDRGIGDTSSHLTLVMLGPAIIPIAIFGPMVGGDTPLDRTERLAPLLVWAVIWTTFSIWRGLRMMKAQSAKNARHYDRLGKYQLPPEYADSESALKTTQRRKR